VDLAIGRIHVVVAILVVLGWAAVAHAEDATQAPAGTRTLANTPFQLILRDVVGSGNVGAAR